MRVGAWLLKEKRSIKLNDLSELLGVNRRTLTNWRNQVQKEECLVGRPTYSENLKLRALIKVGQEWKRQGSNVGWRPIEAKLRGQVPTRLIQETLSSLKLLHRNKLRQKLASNRHSVKVHHKNIIWVQDGAKQEGAAHQIIKDRGSFKVISVKKNKNETGSAIIEQLKAAKTNRGLPLVLGTDNGSMYICKETQAFLEENKVIHLKSLPRTPQHNGAVECAVREIKEVAVLNGLSMEESAQRINQNRLRARFSFKSSEKVDDKMSEGYDEEVRQVFYKTCKARINTMEAFVENKRSRRMEERRIIFETLEQFGFIEINRGGLV